MGSSTSHRVAPATGLLLAALVVACARPGVPLSGSPEGGEQRPAQAPPKTKVITIGIRANVEAMSIMGSRTGTGGWQSCNEIHSNGLVTSDFHSRKPIGRLAERAPSLEDGSVALLPDGRMRVLYPLRRGVTWHDGVAFTAQDLAFSYQISSERGIPFNKPEAIDYIDSAEAPDDRTFVLYFKGPYHVGTTLGLRAFWPLPRHLLADAYSRYLSSGNADEVTHHPYWTGEYVHLGPFRLTAFDPGQGTDYQAYDGYFLGRPQVDVIRIRIFSNENTLFSNLLAGTVDINPDNVLSTLLGFQLKEQWEGTGQGTVHSVPGNTRFLVPQWRPWVQIEPAVLDVRVRAALYHAMDRASFSAGVAYEVSPAWSILPPGDRLYEATKDGLRVYAYDPARARAILREVGWSPAPDGALRHGSDGRRFRTVLWTTQDANWEIAVIADFWRRIGLEVEESLIPGPQARNLEFRAHYPGWETSSSGTGDQILGRLIGPAASPQTRWAGDRGGYEDPRALALVNRYRSSLSEDEQFRAVKEISDFVVAELPILPLHFTIYHLGARKGVRALDDVAGGAGPSLPYGTYFRNSHLWDVE